MRVTDLSEYQIIPSYDPGRPSPDDFTVVDRIQLKSVVDVGQRIDDTHMAFALMIGRSVEAVIEFEKMSGEFVIFRRAVAFTKRQGYAASLFKWFRGAHHLGILSDSQMTPEGLEFWNAMMVEFGGTIANLETGESFPIGDPRAVSPEEDNKSSSLYPEPDGQRWVFLIPSRRILAESPFGVGRDPKSAFGYGLTAIFPQFGYFGTLD